MKLLVSWMRELGSYISREFHYTMRELVEKYGWRHVEPWLVSKNATSSTALLEMLGDVPRTVLFWETYDLFNTVQPVFRALGSRQALFADDLHLLWGQEDRRGAKLRAFSDCDVVLTPYAYVFDEFYPELRRCKKVVWTPHAASPDFILPFNHEPEDALLLSGFVGALYPLRCRVKQLHEEGCHEIFYHRHPGYSESYDVAGDGRIGPGYAGIIHRFRAGFTDALTFRYIVAKYFEIPATGALLVADDGVSEPLQELGFLGNVHYVPVCADNLEQKIRYVLDENNRIEIDEIRRRGQELVLCRHTTSHRASLIDAA